MVCRICGVQAFDLGVFRFINNWPDGLSPLFHTLSEANKWTPVRIALLLLLAYMIWRKDLRKPALFALPAAGISNEICDVLKATFQMLRPCVELASLNLRVEKLTSFGTASSHSANMMAIAVLFLVYKRSWGWWWLAVAVLTGISRVYVGVHYPYQVLYGWLVGAAVSMGLVGIDRVIGHWKSQQEITEVDEPTPVIETV